jgi:hypothetical protein
MRCVVSAGEAPFPRGAGQPGVCETRARHRQQPTDLQLIARLGLELAGAYEVIERGQAQAHLPSEEAWAAPGRD